LRAPPSLPLDARTLALVGVALMLLPSLYVNIGSTVDTRVVYEGTIILPAGGAFSVNVPIPYDNGAITVLYAGNEAQVAIRIQGPGGPVRDEVVSGTQVVEARGLPGSEEPYKVIVYNAGVGGGAEAAIRVVASYKAPVYTTTAACPYLLASIIGALLAGAGLGLHRAQSSRGM